MIKELLLTGLLTFGVSDAPFQTYYLNSYLTDYQFSLYSESQDDYVDSIDYLTISSSRISIDDDSFRESWIRNTDFHCYPLYYLNTNYTNSINQYTFMIMGINESDDYNFGTGRIIDTSLNFYYWINDSLLSSNTYYIYTSIFLYDDINSYFVNLTYESNLVANQSITLNGITYYEFNTESSTYDYESPFTFIGNGSLYWTDFEYMIISTKIIGVYDSKSYTDGQASGYQTGYMVGYNDGINSATTNRSFLSLMGAIADVPIKIFRNLFNFDLFGINCLALIMSIITGLLVIYLIKKLIK